jgi:hypothetical protein
MHKRKRTPEEAVASMKYMSDGEHNDAEKIRRLGIVSPKREDMYAYATHTISRIEKWFRCETSLLKWKISLTDNNWKITINNQNHGREL